MAQTASTVLMIRPAHFGYNAQTAASNAFQKMPERTDLSIQTAASIEFDGFVQILRENQMNVLVMEDSLETILPDAIFPNNWISMHEDGKVILYPMCAPIRRLERRKEIVEYIKEHFHVHELIDLSVYEKDPVFLEGTGSMVFDHTHQVAYACLSPRTNKALFLKVCDLLKYRGIHFHATDTEGNEIYHTNVMMHLGTGYVVVCLEALSHKTEREQLIASFLESDLQIIEISMAQMNGFAGNMLMIQTGNREQIIVLSQTAFDSLSSEQHNELQAFGRLLPVPIPTIEKIGGGSVRCMMAEVFLGRK